jgi:hypothetical protein
VPGEGIEPTLFSGNRILSPAPGRISVCFYNKLSRNFFICVTQCVNLIVAHVPLRAQKLGTLIQRDGAIPGVRKGIVPRSAVSKVTFRPDHLSSRVRSVMLRLAYSDKVLTAGACRRSEVCVLAHRGEVFQGKASGACASRYSQPGLGTVTARLPLRISAKCQNILPCLEGRTGVG